MLTTSGGVAGAGVLCMALLRLWWHACTAGEGGPCGGCLPEQAGTALQPNGLLSLPGVGVAVSPVLSAMLSDLPHAQVHLVQQRG